MKKHDAERLIMEHIDWLQEQLYGSDTAARDAEQFHRFVDLMIAAVARADQTERATVSEMLRSFVEPFDLAPDCGAKAREAMILGRTTILADIYDKSED
ncbi:hypothetical protein [Streptomyces sp. A1547]|uniref:hypothetical protein n=1 Tax=Streptomyces sp. A1547 TaxID=2563105 RepID=UPI00109EBE61|nr:hypothetical protein [Streptomyces sp. A1547]THA29626.1 hypothetical protein E6W17_39130 [Streptomyces sp. A1547]